VSRILVTGAGGAPAANFVDSLRQADEEFHIVGADANRYMLELAPVDARYLLPTTHDPSYVDELNAIVDAEQISFVHAQPDQEVHLLARRRDELRARTFLPSSETVELCQDKARLATALRDAGAPSPDSLVATSRATLVEAARTIVREHGRAWVRARRGAGSRAALPVSSGDLAGHWADYWVSERGLTYEDFMVSQFLPGAEYAYQSLWRDGELVSAGVRERVEYLFGRLYPSGQSSSPSVARTVVRPDVEEAAAAAVLAADEAPTGVFCVDLKEDAAGRPLVTEINAGRFFTTSNFFARAGLNMPYWYVKLGLGEALPDVSGKRLDEGLYWIRMVDAGYKLVREGEWTSGRAGRRSR
jgi:carbamoyl-phosphate synthase large subunit